MNKWKAIHVVSLEEAHPQFVYVKKWKLGRGGGAPEWLSRLGIWLLVLAQVMISFMVCEFEPRIGLCADSAEPAWDSLSLSLCPSPASALSVSLKNK